MVEKDKSLIHDKQALPREGAPPYLVRGQKKVLRPGYGRRKSPSPESWGREKGEGESVLE